ncbi:MAG: response regulator transcription factor [Bacteroidetes bacterium]|nr:response regulator transcription factor [Bacteroidota bacterium]MBS1649900.1 response regulator transcription factor [Bacteroidota bacterium]
MNNTLIRIVIIDDHRLFNDGLFAMLSTEKTVLVVEQVYDSRTAVAAVSKFNPEMVLVDFNMPHINGIELTKLLKEKNPQLKIIVLSMYNDERFIELFKKNNANGYLLKTVSVEKLINVIHDVANGENYFPELYNNHSLTEDVFLKKLTLSNRELEVINLIKQGLQTKEIASRLNISYYTAETHRKNIKLKIGIKGETDFLKFIYENC